MKIGFDVGFGKDRTISTMIDRNTSIIQCVAFKLQPTRFVAPIEEIDSVAALRFLFWKEKKNAEEQ